MHKIKFHPLPGENAYPVLEEGALETPNIIFIDLD